MKGILAKATTTSPTAALLRRVGAFVPTSPDNEARDCWRCPHRWHGLRCDTNSCGCSSSWVDPDVLARLNGARS